MPHASTIFDYHAKKAAEEPATEASGNTGKGWLADKCVICYGSFFHQTCPGAGAYLPGGSRNPHGSDFTGVPKDFIVPGHLKDAGRLKDCGDTKIWLPDPNNRRWRPKASPDSVADEGGEAAEGAARGSGGGKPAKRSAGGSGARPAYSY